MAILVVMAVLGSLTACSSYVAVRSNSNGIGNTATTAATYTFMVTGTGGPAANPVPAA